MNNEPKRPRDANQLAQFIVVAATHQSESPEKQPDCKNPAAVALGRLGGLKGGKARANKLSKARLSQIAKQAAAARWNQGRTAEELWLRRQQFANAVAEELARAASKTRESEQHQREAERNRNRIEEIDHLLAGLEQAPASENVIPSEDA